MLIHANGTKPLVFAVVALCSGCSSSETGRTDSPGGDPLPTCNSTFSDTFTEQGAGPCGAWGTRISAQVLLTREGGTLHMLPDTSTFGSVGGCESTVFDFTNGASVQLLQTEPQWRTSFVVHPTGGSSSLSTTIEIAPNPPATDAYMTMTDHVGGKGVPIPYTPGASIWLRFMPQGPQSLVAQYSTDHTTWLQLGADMYPTPPVQASITMQISGISDGHPAIWDNLNVLTCPP